MAFLWSCCDESRFNQMDSGAPTRLTHMNEIDIDQISPGIKALLMELKNKLINLKKSGESGSIDLRTLPLTPYEFTELKQLLGNGEINVQLDALGTSEIKETQIKGIWWISHFNANQELLTEIIEVTLCPDILKTATEDLSDSISFIEDFFK